MSVETPVPVVALIQRSCMRDKIRDVIVTRILDGSYAAGERLIELSLAREFNVSQAPVREALRELEALGLVQSERYRGTRVRKADTRELMEAYEMRAVLEERAAQLAVPCPPQARCKKCTLRPLRVMLLFMRGKPSAFTAVSWNSPATGFSCTPGTPSTLKCAPVSPPCMWAVNC